MFTGVMNHASLSGTLMVKSGFGRCQENATVPTVKVGALVHKVWSISFVWSKSSGLHSALTSTSLNTFGMNMVDNI